jgi:hypothetical protein
MNVINTYLVNIVKQKEWYTNRILNPTQVTSFMLHLTKQITNCGFDIHLQYISFIYSKLMCTYVSSQRGDNSCSCQYLFGCAIFWESLVQKPKWDGNLLTVTDFSIPFIHGGVDQSSTQSAFFVIHRDAHDRVHSLLLELVAVVQETRYMALRTDACESPLHTMICTTSNTGISAFQTRERNASAHTVQAS